ncbi:MAG: ComEC/Rec2 family competence protein, partial [Rhodothermales bacterium]
LPIVLHHFGRVSVGGLLLNLVGVPVSSVALASGVATVVSTVASAPAADVFGSATEFLVTVLLHVADSGDRLLGWTYVRWNLEHSSDAAAIAFIVAILAVWRRPRLRWGMMILTLSLISALLWVRAASGTWRPQLDVIFLDVGQGDAILIRLPNGEAMLVDAGVRTPFRDAGSGIILPVLESVDVDRIHTAVITHPDSDHLGGLPALLRSIPIGRVLDNGAPHSSNLFRESGDLIDSLKIPRRAVRSGDTLSIDPSVRIRVLHPPAVDNTADANDNSIVLQIRFGESTFLLMGDAPSGAERAMMTAYDNLLEADVVMAGHHGSSTSTSEAFVSHLRETGARTAVISVALRNRYGLPDESVIHRLSRAGFSTLSTSSDGAIWMRSDGVQIYRNDWRR